MLEDPNTWIQGGLASLAILELGVILLILRYVYKLVTNHLNYADVTMGKISKSLDGNTRILERVERKLDANGFRK